MPYITRDRRREADPRSMDWIDAENAGELNFQITCLLLSYLNNKKLSYQTINDILGALEGAKAEFYRRIAVPYEQSKIRQNGDVYPL